MIVRKVQEYLDDYMGEMTTPGTPRYNCEEQQWHVPVLVRTPRAILPVGEFIVDEKGNFVSVPDKEVMLRIVESQLRRLPHLVFGDAKELQASGFEVVTV